MAKRGKKGHASTKDARLTAAPVPVLVDKSKNGTQNINPFIPGTASPSDKVYRTIDSEGFDSHD